MNNKARLTMYILTSGLFLLLDQLLKYFARLNPDYTYYLWPPWLGWEYFGNTGIAFSLPIPNWLVVFSTPFILLGLILFLYKKPLVTSYWLPVTLIFAGAISNYFDRILFGVTIDYLRILTSIINLADVMIVGGAMLLIVKSYKVKS